MKSQTILILPCLLIASMNALHAQSTADRLNESAAVLKEILSAPDQNIPQDLLDSAHCLVIVPGVKKAAFIVGGKFGRGFTICRSDTRSAWGAPGAVRMEGGSVGFQIGVSETDVVMLVMNKRGMDRLLQSKFTLGAGASVAAGPVGRSSSAQTDAKLTAQILSYSRSRGLFAGISLKGATLRQDLDENQELYGRRLTNKEIVMQSIKAPEAAAELIALLNQYSHKEAASKE